MRLTGARFLSLFLVSSSIALGCGGEVIIPSQSSNATSGNGGAAGSATASGAGGMMGGTGGTMGVGGSFVRSTSTGIQITGKLRVYRGPDYMPV